MSIKWIHILDQQPIDNSVIIQLFPPYECYEGNFKSHYTMGMKKYREFLPHKDYLELCGEYKPNFWWIYAKDFPFPIKY